MSKKLKWVICLVLVVCMVGGVSYYLSLPTYYVHNSFRESNGSKRVESTLRIVVYKRHNDQSLYDEIADEYIEVNGSLNELELQLFRSRSAMSDNSPYKTVIYDYDNNTRTIK